MTPPNIQDFFSFVEKREAMRLHKMQHGNTKTFKDKILANHRFCNINREHDAVTVWMAQNIRAKLYDAPMYVTAPCIFLARIYNEPKTLVHLADDLLRQDFDKALCTALELKKTQSVLRGAYMVVSNGIHNANKPTVVYFTQCAKALTESVKAAGAIGSFEDLAKAMLPVEGCGPFYYNQVVADLRYMPISQHFPDWDTFVLAGPGTQRGLNRLHNRKVDANVRQGTAKAELLAVRDIASTSLSKDVVGYYKDINNLSNSFCEYDKYCRGREQLLNGKRLTLRKYN